MTGSAKIIDLRKDSASFMRADVRAEAKAMRKAFNHELYVNSLKLVQAEYARLMQEYVAPHPTDSPLTREAREENRQQFEKWYLRPSITVKVQMRKKPSWTQK